MVNVPAQEEDNTLSDEDDMNTRVVRYHLGPQFLRLKNVGLDLTFSIGPKEVKNMTMIEKHFFRGKVIREYAFNFGFIIPNSTNNWDFVYELP